MLSLFLYRVAYTAICQGCRSIKLESQMRVGGSWRRWLEENKRICQQLLLCVLHIDWHCTTANSRQAGWLVAGLGSLVPKAC